MKPASQIDDWDDWPDDVRPLLYSWNHGPRNPAALSFRGHGSFLCCDCAEECEGHRYGTAVLHGRPICDDCLLKQARASLAPVGKA